MDVFGIGGWNMMGLRGEGGGSHETATQPQTTLAVFIDIMMGDVSVVGFN